jgi:hypothetical protein
MEYINADNSHAPSIGRTTVPGLLFVDDLAVSSFTSNGLQKEIHQIVRYCKEWNLKCNLSKSKIVVFKKGGKLKNTERWSMDGQNIEIIDKFKDLGITLKNIGGWRNQKVPIKAKVNQVLTAIDKYLATTPDMKVSTLENIYETLCESRIMYGVELWGLDKAWKEVDRIYGRFCKKTLGLPRCAASGMAEMELGRDSRGGKAMWLAVKYWQRIMHMDIQDPVRQCYE